MLNSIQLKPITGFENYTISESGKVNNGRKDLKTFQNQGGYECLKLTDVGGNKKHFTLHRLVATHFIPNPENKPEVNHLDGNKSNNSVDNLEWCTSSENKRHARDNGLKVYNKPGTGQKFGNSSKYFNVGWDKARGKWKAHVRHNNKNHYPKRFDCEVEAAKHVNWILDTLSLNDRPRNDV